LIVNTNNHESLVCLCVDEILAFDNDWVDGMCDGAEKRKQWDCGPEKRRHCERVTVTATGEDEEESWLSITRWRAGGRGVYIYIGPRYLLKCTKLACRNEQVTGTKGEGVSVEKGPRGVSD
jgi:hypothetical protein